MALPYDGVGNITNITDALGGHYLMAYGRATSARWTESGHQRLALHLRRIAAPETAKPIQTALLASRLTISQGGFNLWTLALVAVTAIFTTIMISQDRFAPRLWRHHVFPIDI